MDKLISTLALALLCAGGAACGKEGKNRNSSRTFTSSSQDLPPTPDSADQSTGADSHLLQSLNPGPPLPRHGFPPPSSGLLDKSAPDLQFGLALTIPFVSLATEKLLHSFNTPGRSFRSWADVAQLLKLNVGGLVLAAVVGVGALLFLPTVFHNRGGILKGFGSNLFDNLIQSGGIGGVNKHFGYGQYETHSGGGYDGYNGGGGWAGGKYGGYGRKDSRDLKDDTLNGTESSIWRSLTTSVARNLPELSECSLYAMCLNGGNSTNLEAAAKMMGVVGGEYAEKLEEAYKVGRDSPSTENCAQLYSRCDKIPRFIDSIGRYIFGE